MSTSASKKGISISISISSVFGCSIDDKSCRYIYIYIIRDPYRGFGKGKVEQSEIVMKEEEAQRKKGKGKERKEKKTNPRAARKWDCFHPQDTDY